MPQSLPIQPVRQPVRGSIRPPGSKSLTNRALVVSALAEGSSVLTGALDSEDTQVMVESLRRLGIDVEHDGTAATIRVQGCAAAIPARQADLWLENSGTSIRFLTAVCCLGQGRYRLDGNARMQARPIGELVESLGKLGANVRCELGNSCPPVIVDALGIVGGTVRVGASVSSQFLSALLMVAPAAKREVTIEIAGELVSEPYVRMTIEVCRAFGVSIESEQPGPFRVMPQRYRGREYAIEPDASAASYFFAAAAATRGEVTVQRLSRGSLQGDVGFVEVLRQMGCHIDYAADSITVRGAELKGIDVEMNAISDTAQTLAAIAPLAKGPTRIRGIPHVRHKETDRITAMATELRRIGQNVIEYDDGLTIQPAPIRPATIETYDDHRMAMSFAITGLAAPGIVIANPQCTAKTYPRFFEDLAQLVGNQ